MAIAARNGSPFAVLAGSLLLLGTQHPADAASLNLVRNGSFEYNAQFGCKVGTTTIHKWSVTAGNVDVGDDRCWGIPAAAGEFWLDLTGSGSPDEQDIGTIVQNVPTVVGRSYRLSFYVGGNPQCMDEAVKSMRVLLDGVVVRKYSINVSGVASDDAQWRRHSMTFTASASPTVLSFQGLKGVNAFTVCGALLDGVSIVAIQ
jgi:hypothetical protein